MSQQKKRKKKKNKPDMRVSGTGRRKQTMPESAETDINKHGSHRSPGIAELEEAQINYAQVLHTAQIRFSDAQRERRNNTVQPAQDTPLFGEFMTIYPLPAVHIRTDETDEASEQEQHRHKHRTSRKKSEATEETKPEQKKRFGLWHSADETAVKQQETAERQQRADPGKKHRIRHKDNKTAGHHAAHESAGHHAAHPAAEQTAKQQNRMLRLLCFMLLFIMLLMTAVYLTRDREDAEYAQLRVQVTKAIDDMYRANAYIVVQNARKESYLLLNGTGEAVMASQNANDVITEVFVPDAAHTHYTFTQPYNSTDISMDYDSRQNCIEMLKADISDKKNTIESADDGGYRLYARADKLNHDVPYIYTVSLNEHGLLECSCSVVDAETDSADEINGSAERTLLWSVSGYQTLPGWKLDTSWYSTATENTDMTQMLNTVKSQINSLILDIMSDTGDATLEWNVTGEQYVSLNEQDQSLNVDKAILYLQNYNLGFTGNKQELMSEINTFYADTDNKYYRLYTALQYIGTEKGWLIPGVQYQKKEVVIEAETAAATAQQ